MGTTAKTSSVRGVLSVMPVSRFKRKIIPAKANISTMGGELEVIKVGEKIIIQEPKIHSDETLKDKAEECLLIFSLKGARCRPLMFIEWGKRKDSQEVCLKSSKRTWELMQSETQKVIGIGHGH